MPHTRSHALKPPAPQDDDRAAMNRAVYEALKHDGIYFVADHEAKPGSGARDVQSLHRIEGAFVRQEAEAAGFEMAMEAMALRNPDDDHTGNVFGPLRGATDRWVYIFRKPAN